VIGDCPFPVAAAAMRRCEDRLRVIHPYAMARSDRLRAGAARPAPATAPAAPRARTAAHLAALSFPKPAAPAPGQPAPGQPGPDQGGQRPARGPSPPRPRGPRR